MTFAKFIANHPQRIVEGGPLSEHMWRAYCTCQFHSNGEHPDYIVVLAKHSPDLLRERFPWPPASTEQVQ